MFSHTLLSCATQHASVKFSSNPTKSIQIAKLKIFQVKIRNYGYVIFYSGLFLQYNTRLMNRVCFVQN